MSLERRVAYWVNLGSVPYQEVCDLQKILVNLRRENKIKDIILASNPHLEVNFGLDENNNLFSEEFIQQVKQERDDFNEELAKQILSYRGIKFSKSDRGGGATVLSPGQFMYFPIVDYEKITGRSLDIGGYKTLIYGIMFETLKALGVKGINYTSDKEVLTKQERRDVWVQRDGKSLKMGSKGLRLSGNVAHHGFVLYVHKEGMENFDLIKPCGYDPKEVNVTSVEEELGRKIGHDVVHSGVKKYIRQNFRYDEVKEISLDELNRMIEEERLVA